MSNNIDIRQYFALWIFENKVDVLVCKCSNWINRDLPGGVGDYEQTDSAPPTIPSSIIPCPKNYYVQVTIFHIIEAK